MNVEVPVAQRCEDINRVHTLSVYKYTCRALFEAHKLLFSLQLCFKILESGGSIPLEEFNFFSFGAPMFDRNLQKHNPGQDWLSPICWDGISELDKLPGFQGIVSSFEQQPREWKNWFMSAKPEEELIPGEWTSKCTEVRRFIHSLLFMIMNINYFYYKIYYLRCKSCVYSGL